jgi:hypothetical protein
MVTTRLSKKKAEDLDKSIEEKVEKDHTQPTTEDEEPISTIEKKLREKKPMPSVQYLLEHGDPNAPPLSFKDTVQLFGGLLIVFVGSLIAWHFLFLKDSGPGQAKNWGRDEM